MSDGAEVIRKTGDFAADELAAIAAALIDIDADAVCQVSMVVIAHPAEGGHELMIATTIEDDPAAVAAMLRHAADHAHGGCKPCRKQNARRQASAN